MQTNDFQTLWNRRDRLHIMAEIIEAAKGSQLKTRIMYMVNLSFSQVNDYLSFLTERGFLRSYIKNKKKFYEATPKGILYIDNYMEMLKRLSIQDLPKSKILMY